MKTKMYIADCNAIIADKFNFAEITLRYADAHKEEGKKGAIYSMITEGTNFICVGNMDDEHKFFKNWEDAAEYAKTLTYKYYIGVRPSGKSAYNIIAICENKAEVVEDAAEDIIAEIIAENKTEYRVHYKTAKNSFYTEVKSIEFKSKDNADKFIAIMKAEGYEIVKWDDESYMGDPKAIAAAKITTYAQSEDNTEAAPAEEEENNLAYESDIYTFNVEDNGEGKSEDYETIDELVKWAKMFPYEWFKVNNNDRLSFQFKRETYDDGGHQYRLYMHDNYGVLGDSNWYICNRMTYNNEYKLMGKIMDCMFKANDNMPQTEEVAVSA